MVESADCKWAWCGGTTIDEESDGGALGGDAPDDGDEVEGEVDEGSGSGVDSLLRFDSPSRCFTSSWSPRLSRFSGAEVSDSAESSVTSTSVRGTAMGMSDGDAGARFGSVTCDRGGGGGG